MEMVAALTVSTAVREVESAASRMCKGGEGIINNN
jgi:hypothetical protein